MEGKIGSVLIIRADSTPDALKRARLEQTYDIDRAGRRRRRYKIPQIEKDWIAYVKEERRLEREQAKIRNAERG